MKSKIFAAAFLMLAFTVFSFAQSVVITPKKVTYKRPKPESEYKKSFVVTYPKVKAATPVLSKKIEAEISYEKNNELKIQDELSDYQWLEEASYKVIYNKNGLLDIILSTEGSAAYPSTFNKEVVVDIKTGSRVKAQDVFTNPAGLAAQIQKMQTAEIKKARADYKKDPESADFDGNEYFNAAKIAAKNLDDFSVSDKGIAFKYDYEFAHAVLALQPDGTYFFTWAQIKPYIKRGGLLEKFVR